MARGNSKTNQSRPEVANKFDCPFFWGVDPAHISTSENGESLSLWEESSGESHQKSQSQRCTRGEECEASRMADVVWPLLAQQLKP